MSYTEDDYEYDSDLPSTDLFTKRFNHFKMQDVEAGNLNLLLEVQGREFFVNDSILTTSSEVFKVMLSCRWNSQTSKKLKIETFSYEACMSLITYLYIGNCDLNYENIEEMVDIAEFYQIPSLTKKCDKYLSCRTNTETLQNNIQHLVDFSIKYSLTKFQKFIKTFISNNINTICKNDKIFSYTKTFVEFLADINRDNLKLEKGIIKPYNTNEDYFFQQIYTWAEGLIKTKNEKYDNEQMFILIKEELVNILPKIKFNKMSPRFLLNFVLEKGFFLTSNDYYSIYSTLQETTDEEYAIKSIFDLVKRQVNLSNNDDHLTNTKLRQLLKNTIPKMEFGKVDKSFLTNFIISNNIISEGEANQIGNLSVQINNGNNVLLGTINKDIGLFRSFETQKLYTIKRQNKTKIKFLKFKVALPNTPSIIQKTNTTEWYLCLEKDGILTLKHHLFILPTDYLVAIMHSDNQFQLTPNLKTVINIFRKPITFSSI